MRSGKRALLVLLVLLLGMLPFGVQADIVPMDESHYYVKAFGDTGFEIVIPFPYIRSGMQIDDPTRKQMVLVTEKMDESPYFLIEGARDEAYVNLELKDLTAKDVDWFFYEEEISEMSYKEDIGNGLPAVEIICMGDDGIKYTRYWAGIREDWMLLLSFYPGTLEDNLDVLNEPALQIFDSMMVPFQSFEKTSEIVIPNTTMRLTLPEGSLATVDPYVDEGKVVYFIMEPSPGQNRSIAIVTVIEKPELLGKTLDELKGEELNEFAGLFVVGAGNLQADWLPGENTPAVLLFKEGGTPTFFYQLLTLQEGYGVSVMVTCAPDYFEQAHLLTWMSAFFRNLVLGKEEAASLDEPTFIEEVDGEAIEIAIPYGYYTTVSTDENGMTQYLAIDPTDMQKNYLLIFDRSEEVRGTRLGDYADDFAAIAKRMEERAGSETVLPTETEEGLLGLPTIKLQTPSNTIISAHAVLGDCKIQVLLQSFSEPLTEAEVAMVFDRLHFLQERE